MKALTAAGSIRMSSPKTSPYQKNAICYYLDCISTPMTHLDKLKQPIEIGDTVAYAMNGQYAGVNIGEVTAVTPKRIKVQPVTADRIGRKLGSDTHTIDPSGTIVINTLIK